MHLAKAPEGAAVVAGCDVFCPTEGADPCGRVINSAQTHAGVWVLFEAPFKQTQAGELRAGAIDGPPLQIVALPYSIEAPSKA